ncbi:MAG: ABC transporter permease subunit [Clostridiales bacterium]|nr:ABC transporter permease subunit [Clostridiales bacterium]
MISRAIPYVKVLEEERAGRKQGLLATAAASLLTIILTLPFVPWISIVGLSAESAAEGVRGGYSLLNFLGYVQITVQGALGLPAMILLLAVVGAAVLHAIGLARVLAGHYGAKGLLGYYTLAKGASLLSFLSATGMLVFLSFANAFSKLNGFAATPAPFLVMLVSVAGYTAAMLLERRERVLNHEHGFLEEFRRNWILFLFLIPCFVYFMINNYLPMVGTYFAFTQFNFRDGLFASPFVGLKNFEYLAQAELFKLTRNTILYNIVFILLGNVLQIAFAIMISWVVNKRFRKISQTMIFMPYFVSFVILKVFTYNLFEYNHGLINTMFNAQLDFYNTPAYWPLIITIFYIWKNLGYGMVVYLATIMGISEELYEAARVDGASVWQQIRYITLPLLKPTFIILLLYSLGGIMRGQFELFFQLVGNNGVLFGTTDIIDTFVYRITTSQVMSMGMGAAAGLYQSVFGFIIIMGTNYIIKRRNSEYALF